MAVVIIGGLITSTLLNLFITPSLYVRFSEGRHASAPDEGGAGPRGIFGSRRRYQTTSGGEVDARAWWEPAARLRGRSEFCVEESDSGGRARP